MGFDGSSIRGWQAINASDMLAIPDPTTAMLDPFFAEPTVSVIANIIDPITHKDYSRDPRYVARKTEEYLRKSGLADTVFIGPELEFFIFDQVRYEQNEHIGMYEIDSVEGAWNTARFEEPNLGYKPSFKGGYFPVSPTDTYHDLRTEMVQEMEKVGIIVEAHHHEVATAGQSEIDMRFAPLLKMGDQLMWYKYIIKNVAKRRNKTVTFMPKPIFEDNGSGHAHARLVLEGRQAAVRRRQVRRAVADGAVGGRRRPQARQGPDGHYQPDDQFVPPAGAGFRGPGEPGLQCAESFGRRSASRCTPTARRPSGWSAGSPIRPATAT